MPVCVCYVSVYVVCLSVCDVCVVYVYIGDCDGEEVGNQLMDCL